MWRFGLGSGLGSGLGVPLRLRLRRHPVGFWVLTGVLAALTAGAVLEASARADAAAGRWGRMASVVVVARPVAMGQVVGRGDVRVETVPARLAADGAVRGDALGSAVGRVALAPLWPGEVLLRQRLAPDGLRGVAALVPEGMRAVAVPVPVGEGALRVAVGDVVDVLATFEAHAHEDDADDAAADPTAVVVESATVVDVAEGAVTLAVPAEDAPRLAFAASRATLTLALSPPPHRISTAPPAVEMREAGR